MLLVGGCMTWALLLLPAILLILLAFKCRTTTILLLLLLVQHVCRGWEAVHERPASVGGLPNGSRNLEGMQATQALGAVGTLNFSLQLSQFLTQCCVCVCLCVCVCVCVSLCVCVRLHT